MWRESCATLPSPSATLAMILALVSLVTVMMVQAINMQGSSEDAQLRDTMRCAVRGEEDIENNHFGSIEVLRDTPKRQSKRKQSPSPERGEKGQKTPRTQCKDKPKKMRGRLPCRNDRCKTTFASREARDRHERLSCASTTESQPELPDKTFEVPSHKELGLNTLQCRLPSCGKIFNYPFTRVRHERDVHRFAEQRERTLSPQPFPTLFKEPTNTSFRPQSCPPNINIQVESPSSESYFQSPQFQSTPRPSPLPPPQLDISTSPPNSSQFQSTPHPSPLPPPQSDKSPSSSICSDVSSSARVLFADLHHPHVGNVLLVCQFCYFDFKTAKNLKRHDCIFNPDKLVLEDDPILLTRPEAWKETLNILRQLCIEDIVKLCQINKWAIPSVYPLTFPGKFRLGHLGIPPVLVEMSSFAKDDAKTAKNSLEILRKLVNMHNKVKLPRYVLVLNNSSGRT